MTITELHPEPAPQTAAVTLYTKPACVQCDQTKKLLDRNGIEYTAVDVTEDPGALRYIKETLGYLAAPVVVAWPDGAADPVDWSGFRPDLIKRHLARSAA